jgi:hypothetical protein
MSSSYRRSCRYCGRSISMRQMPAGQWVAFENNQPHDCEAPPSLSKARKIPNLAVRPSDPTPGEFPDFDIKTPTPTHAPRPAQRPGAIPVPPPRRAPASPASSAEPVPRSSIDPSSSGGSPLSGGYRPFSRQSQTFEKATPGPVQLTQAQPQHSSTDYVARQSQPNGFRYSFRGAMDRLGGALSLIMVSYMIIGAIHSTFFELFISRTDCLYPKGLVAVYCKTGMGLAHLTVVFGWPFYWL